MPKQKITALQIVVLVLSVYVLVAMTADILLDLRPEISELLFFIDNIVCGVFILEFLTLLYKAPDKLDYIKKGGWLDLISSIPTVGYFRFARVAKIIVNIHLKTKVTLAIQDFILPLKTLANVNH